jgi:hypothetical protein
MILVGDLIVVEISDCNLVDGLICWLIEGLLYFSSHRGVVFCLLV